MTITDPKARTSPAAPSTSDRTGTPYPSDPLQNPSPVTPDQGTQTQRDALAYIRSVLDTYGLGSEADWAWSEIVTGVSQTQLLQDLRQRQAYQQRFSGMKIRQDNGLPAISEGEYVSYERQAYQLMLAANMPAEFRTRDYFAQLIGVDKSINELNGTITNAYLAVTQAPPEVRQTFTDFFGVNGDAAFASYILDPSHSETSLERMANEAIVAGTGRTFGFDTGVGLAEQIVQRGLTGQARSTYQSLAQSRPLFNETVSENQDLTETQGIQAAFGLDSTAEAAVRKRMEERQAAFGGQADSNVTQQGAVGLGAARQ